MPRRTALIVPVPEAEPAVRELRAAHDSSAALGVPAHITLLSPFATVDRVDEEAVGATLAPFAAFDFTLDRVERFSQGVVWLHPEPSAPFASLTAAIVARWPEYPPYEGVHAEVIPHLTVSVPTPVVRNTVSRSPAVPCSDAPSPMPRARNTVSLPAAADPELLAAVDAALPIACRATEVRLLEETPGGRWMTRRTYVLGVA
jgi:hypothetical protein